MENKITDKPEILALTGLRFVAAFYVFIFHMNGRWSITSNQFLGNILSQGAIGMSMFFMLSGFVLTYVYGDGKTSYKNYLVNRFSRIYTLYIFAAVISLPWIKGFLAPTIDIKQIILLIISNILVVQAWIPQFFNYWNDGGSWSISVEFFCYLLLPIIIRYLTKLTNHQLFIVIIISYLIASFLGIVVTIFPVTSITVFYFMPIFRLPEFIIGICLCLIKKDYFKKKNLMSLVLLLCLILYLGFLGDRMFWYIGHNFIFLPILAFFIFYSRDYSVINKFLSSPIMVWLGKISYCFYSLQVLIVFSLISYHDKFVEYFPFIKNNHKLALVSFIILIIFSALAHYVIEIPARLWIKNYIKKRAKNA